VLGSTIPTWWFWLRLRGPESSVSDSLLVHPEEEDDVEPVSSTSETRSEDEEAVDVDESVLRLAHIAVDGPEVAVDWRRCVVESCRAIARTYVRPEEAEDVVAGAVGTWT
jgi:hypothetical protein